MNAITLKTCLLLALLPSYAIAQNSCQYLVYEYLLEREKETTHYLYDLEELQDQSRYHCTVTINVSPAERWGTFYREAVRFDLAQGTSEVLSVSSYDIF